ncbi:MAG: hypothetical protein Ct9H90mP8_3300 [Pseudomonadota bacterium]|nr:MAG: hypothetical protein Ct9H90mP8_3300 [Pseudomonadota bacterium]
MMMVAYPSDVCQLHHGSHQKNLGPEPNVAANWEMDGNRLAERWWFA